MLVAVLDVSAFDDWFLTFGFYPPQLTGIIQEMVDGQPDLRDTLKVCEASLILCRHDHILQANVLERELAQN